MNLVDDIIKNKYFEKIIQPIGKSVISQYSKYITISEKNKFLNEMKKNFYNDLVKSNKIFVDERKQLLEEKISNIRFKELKYLNLPFNNFFIEYIDDEYCYGIHCSENLWPNELMKEMQDEGYAIRIFYGKLLKNNSKPIYDLKYYVNTYISYNSIPIIKNECIKFEGCCNKQQLSNNIDLNIKIKNNNLMVNKGNFLNGEQGICERTIKTANYCETGRVTVKALKIFIYAINRINNRIIEIRNKTKVNNKANSSSTYSFNNDKWDNSIKINSKLVRYIYGSNKEYATGVPKAPHNRRGHFRHYKSGKVIWINESQIHRDSNKELLNHTYKVCS